MKNNLITRLLLFIIGALICSIISVAFAYSYLASEVGFDSLDQSWNVDNVRDALDYLKHNQIYANYSLTEREIGTWIDGKRVYEKVIPGLLPTATTGVSIRHDITNFGGLIKFDITWYDTSDKRWFTGTRYYYSGGTGYSIGSESIQVDSTYIHISGIPNTINWQARTNNVYIIMQYYKTTD